MSVHSRNTTNSPVFVIDGSNTKSSFQTDTRTANFTRSNSESLSSISTDFNKGDEDFSFGCWVYPDDTTQNQLMSKFGNLSNRRSYLLLNNNSSFQFYVSNDGVLNTNVIKSFSPVGSWNFVVAVHDSVNDEIKISVNASAFTTVAFSGGVYNDPSPVPFYIGRDESGQFLDGKIDNAFFYDKALTQQEVTDLYNSGNGTNYANADKVSLVSWWSLNENGETRKDSHGTNDLTDNNSVGFNTGKVSEYDFFYARNMKDLTDGTPQNGVELVNGAWEFDGVNDYIDFGDNLDIGTSDWSMEFWINLPTSNTSRDWFISKAFAEIGRAHV